MLTYVWRYQGVAHTLVPLGHPIADADSVKLKGQTAGFPDALIDRLRDTAQVRTSRHHLVPAGGDGDEGFLQVVPIDSEG